MEEALHIKIQTGYGLSEVPGPGIAYECRERQGMHINEDHFIAEVVDPENGGKLLPGEKGELVLYPVIHRADAD